MRAPLDAEVGATLDASERILQHTVGGDRGERAGRREKGLARPVRRLARDIGPRPAGSREERSAADFVAAELRALDIEVEVQGFRAPPSTAWSEMLVHLPAVLGVAVFPASSHLSYALVCLGFLLFLLEYYGRSPFAWLQSHRHSQNVVARLQPQRAPRRTLVVAAHMDSPRAAFYRREGLQRFARLAFLADFAAIAALFMIFTACYAGFLLSMEKETLDFFWRLGLLVSAIPAISAIALLGKAMGSATPGGNDNASGVAALLELARFFAARPPLATELWLVATGAACAGGAGARSLLRHNRKRLRGAYLVFMDGVGRGFPVAYRREGMLIPFRANRGLSASFKRAGEAHAHFNATLRRNSAYLGEGFQLLSRGRRAMTVSSREDSRHPRFWRSARDDYDNVDLRSLRRSLDFMSAFVDAIDRGDMA